MLVILGIIAALVLFRTIRIRSGSGERLAPTAEVVARETLLPALLDLDRDFADELTQAGFTRAACQISRDYARYVNVTYDWEQIAYVSPHTPMMVLLALPYGQLRVIFTCPQADGSNPATFYYPDDMHDRIAWMVGMIEVEPDYGAQPVRVTDWNQWLAGSLAESVEQDVIKGSLIRTDDPTWARWPWRRALKQVWEEFRYAMFTQFKPLPKSRTDRGFAVMLKQPEDAATGEGSDKSAP
jgi:hypothetical protein